MKKFGKTAAVLALAALSVISGLAAARKTPEDTAAEPPVQPAMAQSGAHGYMLCDQDGFVTVFQDGEAISVTDIETDTLNEHDRQLLRAGIAAEDKAQLLSLLEDLSS